jgi:acyl carrier protein
MLMTTLERLQTLLLDHYPLQREDLTPQARLEDLQIDSLGVMELFFNIEDEFQIKVPNDQVQLQTVGDVVDYIDRLIAEQNGTQTVAGSLP